MVMEAPVIAKDAKERGIPFAAANNLFAAELIENIASENAKCHQQRVESFRESYRYQLIRNRYKKAGFSDQEAHDMAIQDEFR